MHYSHKSNSLLRKNSSPNFAQVDKLRKAMPLSIDTALLYSSGPRLPPGRLSPPVRLLNWGPFHLEMMNKKFPASLPHLPEQHVPKIVMLGRWTKESAVITITDGRFPTMHLT